MPREFNVPRPLFRAHPHRQNGHHRRLRAGGDDDGRARRVRWSAGWWRRCRSAPGRSMSSSRSTTARNSLRKARSTASPSTRSTSIFALVYALLAQKRSLPSACRAHSLVWVALAWACMRSPGRWLRRSSSTSSCSARLASGWRDRCATCRSRASHAAGTTSRCARAMVALLVGITVSFSFRIGPAGSGILAVFPIMLISMHDHSAPPRRRQADRGGDGQRHSRPHRLCLACVVLHFAAQPSARPSGSALALATSVAWRLAAVSRAARSVYRSRP